MERVAFLIEATNERIICMLNPEDLVVRRVAGVQVRQTTGGHLTGHGLADDPLLYTGGGRTELRLNLLFDVGLAGSTIQTDDVRQLTAPLWNLTENRTGADGFVQPPLVRMLWGKHWNVCGVITAISERLEEFTQVGAPGRSWLRMKMLRVQPPGVSTDDRSPFAGEAGITAGDLLDESFDAEAWLNEIDPDAIRYHEVIHGERLDQVAHRYYGDSRYWRLLATFNAVENPDMLEAGASLQIPPAPSLMWRLLANFESLSAQTQFTFSSVLRVNPLSPFRVQL